MTDLQALAERQDIDPEMVPKIIPVESRLAIGMVTAELLAMVTRVNSLVPSKETIPGTSMMLVEGVVEKNVVPHVRISAWDGAQWMQVVSSGQVRILAPGAAVMPAKKILEALRLAPASVSKLSVIGSEAVLTSGRAQWTFATPTHDSLGVHLEEEDVDLHEVSAESLRTALRAVSAAASTSSARPAFLQVHVANGTITTTDGARMHRMAVPGLSERVSIDVPVAIVSQVLDLLSDIEGDRLVQFGANERRIHFHIGASRIISQRILLPFPDVEGIIVGAGMTNERSFTVLAEDLRQAIKRVRINADPDRSAISLGIRDLHGGDAWVLAIHSRDANNNYAQEVIEAQWTGTKPREFVLNHKHLADALAQVRDEHAIIRVGEDASKNQKSPLLIRDGGFQAVLTQMRLH